MYMNIRLKNQYGLLKVISFCKGGLLMRVLVFAPHNDDEVLGVGGTIAKYSATGHEVFVCEVTRSGNEKEVRMIREEAARAHKVLGVKETFFLDFPVVRLKEVPLIDLNASLLEVVKNVEPNVAFIPHKGDMHMDHTLVAHSAMVAMRPIENAYLETVYAYETLSETEWNMPTIDNVYIPNVWSDITGYIETKKAAMSCYQSQVKEAPHPRSNMIIESLARLRGSTIGVAYAESFMMIRMKLI